jgi:hypothetical protein
MQLVLDYRCAALRYAFHKQFAKKATKGSGGKRLFQPIPAFVYKKSVHLADEVIDVIESSLYL